MGRTLFRSFLKILILKNPLKKTLWKFKKIRCALGLFFFFPFTCSGVLSVFDSSTYGLTSQLLSSFRSSFSQIKMMTSDIESMRNILGNGSVFNYSEIESMLKIERASLSAYSTSGIFSKDDVKSFDFLSLRKFFEKSWLGSFNDKKYMSRAHQEQVVRFREFQFKESILSGLAFVVHQKGTLKQSSMDLSFIIKEAELGENLRSDSRTTNKLLSFIAHEIIQTRALLIQVLEVQNMKEGVRLPIALEKRPIKQEEYL